MDEPMEKDHQHWPSARLPSSSGPCILGAWPLLYPRAFKDPGLRRPLDLTRSDPSRLSWPSSFPPAAGVQPKKGQSLLFYPHAPAVGTLPGQKVQKLGGTPHAPPTLLQSPQMLNPEKLLFAQGATSTRSQRKEVCVGVDCHLPESVL